MFHQFADEFMGVHVEQVQADLNNLIIKNTRCVLRARLFTAKPEGLPWDIHISLSFFRKPGPYDSWLGVQFAKEICKQTAAQSFCNIPSDFGIPGGAHFWQLTFFQAPNGELISEIMQLQKVDDGHFLELNSYPADLRNFELFHTPLPYR